MPAKNTIYQDIAASGMAVVNDPLLPYVPSPEKPWDARRVAHLYRRLGFGASNQQIQAGLLMSPSDLIDQLLDAAADLGPPDPPYWAGYTTDDYQADPDLKFVNRDELRYQWLNDMLDEGIRAKMALFWHNHFVTGLNVYDCNAYLWDYYSLINAYAFGNFRIFTREMGKNAAMLVYLNGNQNIATEPNENYARELMELFTMGEGNGYSQADIVELARALTGWQAQMYQCTPPFFEPTLHDGSSKTIFGQSANFTFTTAHNLIFTERAEQVSRYITGKLYKQFVYRTIDEQVIEGLATTIKSSNWELLPVIKQLVKSEHFFEDAFIGAQLKMPLESMIPILKMGNSNAGLWTDNQRGATSYWAMLLGQQIFDPPNVAGWPGHRKWINESTLVARWDYAAATAYWLSIDETLRENLRSIAQDLTNDGNDPVLITKALTDYFLSVPLEPVYQAAAVINFKSGIPENYYADGSWNLYWDEAPYQIVNLLYYLVKLPEFQLT